MIMLQRTSIARLPSKPFMGGALAGKLKPNARHTYGWKRGTILAAFANALLLLMAIGALAWEAVGRHRHCDQYGYRLAVHARGRK